MGEMVTYRSNGGTSEGYLAVPADGGPAPAVIVIQEWWGLVPHITGVADRFADARLRRPRARSLPRPVDQRARRGPPAADGPRDGPGRRGTSPARRTSSRIAPSTGDQVGVVGFCAGGSLALWSATLSERIVGDGRVLPGPALGADASEVERTTPASRRSCTAARTTGSPARDGVRAAREAIEGAGGTVAIHDYPGTRHAFFNDDRPEVYDSPSAARAWARTIEHFRTHSEGVTTRTPAQVAARAAAAAGPGRPRRRRRRLLRLPAAGGVAGGGRRRASGRRSATRTTGAVRCPGSARPTRASRSSGWRRPRTAATAPAGSSPATAPATCSSPRCTGPAWPTSRPASSADDGLALRDTRIFAAVRCAPPDNKPTPVERDTCAPWLQPRGRADPADAAGGGRARRVRLGRVVAGLTRVVRRPTAHAAPDVRSCGALDRPVRTGARPARLLPREPAEHLYRPADAGDAGRRVRPGQGARGPGLMAMVDGAPA